MPSVEEFTRLYRAAGFAEIDARADPAADAAAERRRRLGQDLPRRRDGRGDGARWERDDIAAAVEARLAPALRQPDGSWCADYVRLRFTMRKP